jgi:syntaxin 5
MVLKDRTAEFIALADQIHQRDANEKKPLAIDRTENTKTEFSMLSSQVGKGIKDTTEKLVKLTKLAKNRDLFMDKTGEIQDLTFVIKQDIHNLRKQIAMLEDCVHNGPISKNPQAKTHSQTVVKTLNSKLKSTVNDFKEALEVRNENMKALQETKKMFTGNSRRTLESPLYKSPFAVDSTPLGGSDVVINMGQSSSLMQLQNLPNNVAMERLNTVEAIEKTIIELGEIFQQIGQIVAEQDFLVQRIDHNVTQVLDNTSEAERQIAKYLSKISEHRGLIIKVFFVLIIFILIFVIFVA